MLAYGVIGARLIRVFDTTLRDGEQMAGYALSLDKKLRIARMLDELGVDIIEAGFPASSKTDFATIRILSSERPRAVIAGLARANKADIDAAIDSGVDLVHVFIATSDIHMKYKLRMSREEVLERIRESVEYAKSRGVKVLFSAEDATRSDLEFLVTAYRTAIDAGADIINVPDTVGVLTPSRARFLIEYLRQRLPPIPIDVHFHNDFGMAVANTVTAVEAGADGVQVTVNGFGERAGNAALEEVVAALHFLLGYRTNIRLEKLYDVCRAVAELFGIRLQPNKPIVGDTAFAHESGIHVHGVLNNPFTYEPITPEAVGNRRRIVLGKHSGRHAVEWALKHLGVEPDPQLVNWLLDRIKEWAEERGPVTEEVLARFVAEWKKAEAEALI